MVISSLSRRTFLEASAVTGAAVALGAACAPSALAASGDLQGDPSDEVKRVRTCCRACGKMECGVWVTVRNGRAVRVEGDECAFQSLGNCCNKPQSSIQAA